MILAIIQARSSSKRLPGKVLLPILGRPMLALQVERVARAELPDKVIVATSTEPSDDAIAVMCRDIGVGCFRGSLDDVLERFYRAAEHFGADHIVRLTGDCPLSDPAIIDAVVRLHLAGGYDYTSNVTPPTFPDGLDVEVVVAEALVQAHHEACRASDREHVTVWIREHSCPARCGSFAHSPDLSELRWTVDMSEDFDFAREVFERLYPQNPRFNMDDVLALLAVRPDLKAINSGSRRNEALAKSLHDEAARTQER